MVLPVLQRWDFAPDRDSTVHLGLHQLDVAGEPEVREQTVHVRSVATGQHATATGLEIYTIIRRGTHR